MKSQLSGMPGYLPTHEDHTSHHCLQPAASSLLQPQSLGHDHVLGNDFEHVIDQHAQEQKRAVHLEFPGWQPFHIHLVLKLGVILLARAPVPISLQNILFWQIQRGPGRKDFDLWNKEQLSFSAGYLPHLKHHPYRLFFVLDFSGNTAAVNVLGCLTRVKRLHFLVVGLGSFQPLFFALLPQVVLDDEVDHVSIDEIQDHLLAVKPAVHNQQERVLDHALAILKALEDEILGSWGQRVRASGSESGIHHPTPTQMGKYRIEPKLVVVGEFGPFLLGIVVVKDHCVYVHAHPAAVIMTDILRLHAQLIPQVQRAFRELAFQLCLKAQSLESLSQNFWRRRSCQVKGIQEKGILAEFLDLIKIRFALTQQTAQRSDDFLVRYLGLLCFTYISAQLIYAAYSSQFTYQGQSCMPKLRGSTLVKLTDDHLHQPPCTYWVMTSPDRLMGFILLILLHNVKQYTVV